MEIKYLYIFDFHVFLKEVKLKQVDKNNDCYYFDVYPKHPSGYFKSILKIETIQKNYRSKPNHIQK